MSKKPSASIEQSQIQKALEGIKFENGNLTKLNHINHNNNSKYNFVKIEAKKKVNNRNSSIGRLSSGKYFSLKNSAKFIQKPNEILFKERLNRNSMKLPENIINKTKIESKKNLLPYLSSISSSSNYFKQKIPDKKGEIKIKPFLKVKGKALSQPDFFENMNENKTKEKLSELIEEININHSSSSNMEQEFESYLYKYSEEDNDLFKKYYAVISQKEILFYSSNLKNELCTIWYVNNTIISIPSRMTINKNAYYPIKIIYKNEMVSLLFFDDKESQMEFGNYLKININNINFEGKYEIKEEIGQGHFAVVIKCLDKKNKKEYAVKIINK